MTSEPLDDGRLTWTHLRVQTVERFRGQTPRAEDEARIIDHFELTPMAVLAAIDQVADALQDGKIRWAWSALAARLDRNQTPARDATVDVGPSREQQIARAEQWLHAAGIHLDRASEVEHELFGTAILEPTLTKHGEPIESAGSQLLAAWRDDRALRERMVGLWRELRPRGVRVERAAEQRGRAYAERRALDAAERRARLEAARADDGEPVISDPDPEPLVDDPEPVPVRVGGPSDPSDPQNETTTQEAA